MNFEYYPNFQWFIFVFSLFVLNDLHHPLNRSKNESWLSHLHFPFLQAILLTLTSGSAVSIGPSSSFGFFFSAFPSLTWEVVFTY